MRSQIQLPESPSQVQLHVASSEQAGGARHSRGPASGSVETSTSSTQPPAMHADANAAIQARARIAHHSSTWLALAVMVGTLSVSRRALAEQPAAYRLEWQRAANAESCADESSIRSRVVSQLGRDPFDVAGERTISGRVWRSDDAWHAEIELSVAGERRGRRELSSRARDCASLDAAAVLAVALSIAPEQTREAPAPSVLDSAPDAAARPRVETLPPAAAPAPAPKAQHEQRELAPSSLSASALYLTGALPEAAFGVEATASLGITEGYAAHLLAWHLPPQSDARREHAFTLSALGLGACGRHRWARFELELCPALIAGSVVAVVKRRVEPVDPGAAPWVAVALQPRLRLPLVWPASLQLGASAAVSVQRPRFVLAGDREVGPAAIALGAQLGIALSNF